MKLLQNNLQQSRVCELWPKIPKQSFSQPAQRSSPRNRRQQVLRAVISHRSSTTYGTTSQHALPHRQFHHSRHLKMASDEDYMSFLNKANKDASGGGITMSQASKQQFKTTDSGAEVPKAIKDAAKDSFYVSEADEPFEGVSLNYSGSSSMPDEVEFAELIGHGNPSSAGIEIMDPLDWDRQGQYTNVIEAVREATKGHDVRVYKVPKDSTRVEYWVISMLDGRAVGVKALAVES